MLNSANITYLKWDFNRHLTEVGSDYFSAAVQGEIYHRFVLGVYDIMERLVTVRAQPAEFSTPRCFPLTARRIAVADAGVPAGAV